MTPFMHPSSQARSHLRGAALLGGFIGLLIYLVFRPQPPAFRTQDSDLEQRIEANRLDLRDILDTIRHDDPHR